jgi:hypothetical protein
MGFCAVPHSIDDQALDILPAVRRLRSRAADDVAARLGVSHDVAQLSLDLASVEEPGGFGTIWSFCTLAVFVGLVAALGYVLLERRRAARERDYAGRIVGYLQQNGRESRSIQHICKSLNIPATPRTQQKLLGDLHQMPNFDVRFDSMSVAQTM